MQQNRIIGFTYNNIEYFYERDLQGNIVRIYRKDNLANVAEYTYDAYGNHVVSNLSSKKRVLQVEIVLIEHLYYLCSTRINNFYCVYL